MPRIKLNLAQYKYLRGASFLSVGVQQQLESQDPTHSTKVVLDISVDLANEIRDALGVQLQKYGFDEHYELTPTGRIIDELTDVFHIEKAE